METIKAISNFLAALNTLKANNVEKMSVEKTIDQVKKISDIAEKEAAKLNNYKDEIEGTIANLQLVIKKNR